MSWQLKENTQASGQASSSCKCWIFLLTIWTPPSNEYEFVLYDRRGIRRRAPSLGNPCGPQATCRCLRRPQHRANFRPRQLVANAIMIVIPSIARSANELLAGEPLMTNDRRRHQEAGPTRWIRTWKLRLRLPLQLGTIVAAWCVKIHKV